VASRNYFEVRAILLSPLSRLSSFVSQPMIGEGATVSWLFKAHFALTIKLKHVTGLTWVDVDVSDTAESWASM